jgi:hypothetical protein
MVGFNAGYSAEKLNAAGGLDPFLERLTKKIGQWTDVGETETGTIGKITTASWSHDEVSRSFELRMHPQAMVLIGRDVAGFSNLSQKMADNTDLGF